MNKNGSARKRFSRLSLSNLSWGRDGIVSTQFVE